MKVTKIGEFLKRSKIPIDIEDELEYNRVTIRINHNGVSLRDSELGRLIGTKKQFILKLGQFIVSKIDARYGAFGIAPVEVDNAIITGNFWAYDVDTDLINIDWFNQFTNSPVFYEVCERASSGITHRKYLDEKFFLNYQILLPSVEEQLIQIEKINSQKVSFGELSTELTHQLTLVKKLRQQLLQDAVQGKLVEQNLNDEPASELLKKIKAEKEKLIAEKKLKKEKELPPIKPEEIPFEIPENWVWCRLGEITDIQRGSSPRPKGDSRYFSKIKTDFNWITISDISDYCQDSVLLETREHLTEEGSKHSRYVDVDEFIIAVSGSTTGKCCITGITGFIYDGLAVAKIINKGLNSRFLLNYMMSLYSKINDSKSGASFPNINTEYLNNLLLPLPSKAEQNRIVKKVDELMQYCNELEASIKQSEAQNEKLLQQVLREALKKEPVET
jgi:type I restriction enzyme S subunit